MARKNIELKENAGNTRDLILRKSLEIINKVGVVDFRIESIAEELGLSPGNITYHFSRKEDICVVLWEQFVDKYRLFNLGLSRMLDLKQTYLIFRSMAHLFYDYRGVIIFRGGDIGAMTRDQLNNRTVVAYSNLFDANIVKLLQKNGLLTLSRNDELTKISQDYEFLTRRWWINFGSVEVKTEELEEKLNEYSLLMLYAFYPLMTEKGREEFGFISKIVERGEMDV